MNDTKTITLKNAIPIIIGSMLVSAGAAIWGTIAVANTIPFRVDAMEQNIVDIKADIKNQAELFMPLDLSTERWKNNDIQHENITKQLDRIENALTVHSKN